VIAHPPTQPTVPAWDEAERLAALRRYGILDTPVEQDFDDVVRIAAHVCQAPISVINLIEDTRQWFKAEIGLGVRETPVDVSICAHAILQPGLFVVPDTTKDPRFSCNPLVTGEPHLRFYAGALLETPEGLPLGTVCILDYKPRESVTDEQAFTLKALARQVMAQLELRRALAEQRQAREQQQLLIRELHHRVKNTLATVQSIMRSTARGASSIEEFEHTFTGRVISLAKTHSLLTEERWQAVPLRELICLELEPYDDDSGKRIRIRGPQVYLTPDIAVPLGMAVHELTTNAVKYGALAEFGGMVEVTWHIVDKDGQCQLDLGWVERDGPPVKPPSHQGFGSRLLERVLTTQIQAEVRADYRPEGLNLRVVVPLP
jgi:two-component sensor histidine kinase